MQATAFEFKYRALLFGVLFFVSFAFYAVDSQNVTAAFANSLEHRYGWDARVIARLLLAGATLLVGAAALMRTWASAYLTANVVYAAEIKTAALVADGPYRYVRNPLYFGNLVMSVGMGAMMSRPGFVFCVLAMFVFCYRLILREEGELQAAQTGNFSEYVRAVPRLWPATRPRIRASSQSADWAAGFKVESWCWGFALAVGAFAVTLDTKWFFIVMAVSMGLFWILPSIRAGKKALGDRES